MNRSPVSFNCFGRGRIWTALSRVVVSGETFPGNGVVCARAPAGDIRMNAQQSRVARTLPSKTEPIRIILTLIAGALWKTRLNTCADI